LKTLTKSLRFHAVEYRLQRKFAYGKKGRPGKTDVAVGEKWFIAGRLENDDALIERARKSKGVFILATNILDEIELPSDRILEVYKGQGVSVERGFRFLKDPMFYAESLYLNSPKRIMALIMVMSLSLLVYSLAERKLRASMKKLKVVIPNQVGKPTNNPTIRRVFQIFEYIALAYYSDEDKYEVSNLDDVHETILTALGPPYRKMYFLA
jgi:transposase